MTPVSKQPHQAFLFLHELLGEAPFWKVVRVCPYMGIVQIAIDQPPPQRAMPIWTDDNDQMLCLIPQANPFYDLLQSTN